MRNRLFAALLALALAGCPAWAADATSVSQNIQRGDLQTALQQVDALLVQHPKDPQYQFLKGVILTQQNKDAQAIAVFRALTEQYPELPEPYNNLAVLYARQGLYDKARSALEMAIRANPGFAIAQENLGDIDAKLASRAYQKALQLAPGDDTRIKHKLKLIRELLGQAPLTPEPPAAPVRSQ